MSKLITEIENRISEHINSHQMAILHNILCELLLDEDQPTLTDYVSTFIAAKRVEGCSDKTLRYYESTLHNVLFVVNKAINEITTDDLRVYLDDY